MPFPTVIILHGNKIAYENYANRKKEEKKSIDHYGKSGPTSHAADPRLITPTAVHLPGRSAWRARKTLELTRCVL